MLKYRTLEMYAKMTTDELDEAMVEWDEEETRFDDLLSSVEAGPAKRREWERFAAAAYTQQQLIARAFQLRS